MKVLVLAAVQTGDDEVADALATLRSTLEHQHAVTEIDLVATNFDPRMSEADRRAYETDEPLVDDTVREHARLVKDAEAVVFVYRSQWMGLPAQVKGWLDRVLVMGVAFELHPRTRKVTPSLSNIRRIGVVAVNDRSSAERFVLNDAGRRTLGRTLRLICHPLCRRTFVVGSGPGIGQMVTKRFGAW